jgi:predicted RNase H-like nuclease (RuvC/YqgF family)
LHGFSAAIKVDGNMENLKLPIALVMAMAVQLAGGVWWVSQQAATISSLEETVSQLGSRMAIEDNVNLRRDVQDNAMEIEYLHEEIDELWEEEENLANAIGMISKLQQRLAILENELKYINRDHDNVINKNNH